MTDEKTEKFSIDAKLLTDAVIELNISRRSVSLYPRDLDDGISTVRDTLNAVSRFRQLDMERDP